MPTLHWITFGPERADLSQQVLSFLSEGDALLFTDAGVLHLLEHDTLLVSHCTQGYYQAQTPLESKLKQGTKANFSPVSNEDIAALTLTFERLVTWHTH